MSFETPAQAVSTLAFLLACAYAAWRGGRTERWAAAMIFVNWSLTPFLQNHDAFSHAQTTIFVIDGGLTLGLLAIALTTDRFWPLWAAAFQLLEVLTHIAMIIDHGVRPRAYYIGIEIWSYLLLVALAFGTWREAPRRVRKPA